MVSWLNVNSSERFSLTNLFIHDLLISSLYLIFLGTFITTDITKGFPCSSVGKKKSVCNAEIHLQCRRPGFNSWVRKIPWRRKWQPTPVFLPGKSHGQRSLAGYSPWGHKSWTRLSITNFHFPFAYHLHECTVFGLLNRTEIGT